MTKKRKRRKTKERNACDFYMCELSCSLVTFVRHVPKMCLCFRKYPKMPKHLCASQMQSQSRWWDEAGWKISLGIQIKKRQTCFPGLHGRAFVSNGKNYFSTSNLVRAVNHHSAESQLDGYSTCEKWYFQRVMTRFSWFSHRRRHPTTFWPALIWPPHFWDAYMWQVKKSYKWSVIHSSNIILSVLTLLRRVASTDAFT